MNKKGSTKRMERKRWDWYIEHAWQQTRGARETRDHVERKACEAQGKWDTITLKKWGRWVTWGKRARRARSLALSKVELCAKTN